MKIFHLVLVVFCVILPLSVRSTDETIVSSKDEKGNKVYITFEAVGCFVDKERRALRNMYYDGRALIKWTDRFDATDVIKRCAENAYRQAFPGMFGVQYYGECWSDGSAEERYNMYGVSTNCEHGLGKDWANMVYRYKVVTAKPVSKSL
ncbi:uncharacterized protein LOC116287170 isoform X2 [Actinia tenebrosa]|nr:uncharacterized protein LOC116287170 isoform X2 [Actinia tenebrosa]